MRKKVLYGLILGALGLQYCVVIGPVQQAPPSASRTLGVGASAARYQYQVSIPTCAGSVTETHDVITYRADLQWQEKDVLFGAGTVGIEDRNINTGEVETYSLIHLYGGPRILLNTGGSVRPYFLLLAHMLFPGTDNVAYSLAFDPRVGLVFPGETSEIALSVGYWNTLEVSAYFFPASFRKMPGMLGVNLHGGITSGVFFLGLGAYTHLR